MKTFEEIIQLYDKVNHFGRLMEMNFTILKPGEIEYQMTVSPKHLATATAMHGGAIAALMDAIVGVASLSAVADQGKLVSTVEFKINFLAPALVGDKLKGIGNVVKKGKRIVVTEGKIVNQNNELVAIATATLNAYPIEKSDMY